MTGIIKRTFIYLDKPTFINIYKSLIRSQADYGNLIWFPFLKKDIRIIENTQRRATLLVPELKPLSYERGLEGLNFSTLLYRRKRGDLIIQVFKILNGVDDISPDKFFKFFETTTRRHSKKLFMQRCNKSIRQNSFCIRIIEDWNLLPEEIISSKSVIQFKAKLDKYWRGKRFDIMEIY